MCRRCLLEDIADERSLYDMIQERNRLLPDKERADEEDYARRAQDMQGLRPANGRHMPAMRLLRGTARGKARHALPAQPPEMVIKNTGRI